MESTLRPVIDLMRARQVSLFFSLLALGVFATHEFFSSVLAAPCPCVPGRNAAVAAATTFGPALLLLLAGIALNNHTARLLTGCMKQKFSVGPSVHCSLCLHVMGRSILAPLTWIIAALLRGSYYECGASEFQDGTRVFGFPNVSAVLSVEALARVPCPHLRLNADLTSDQEEDIRTDLLNKMQSESEVAGWALLLLCAVSAFLLRMLALCCSPVGEVQLRYWRLYVDAERKVFDKNAQTHAELLATENVRAFLGDPSFAVTTPTASGAAVRTPSEDDWWRVSRPYAVRADSRWAYTRLHGWVQERAETGATAAVGGGTRRQARERLPLIADEVDSEKGEWMEREQESVL